MSEETEITAVPPEEIPPEVVVKHAEKTAEEESQQRSLRKKMTDMDSNL